MASLKSMLRAAPKAETLMLWICLLAGVVLSSLSYEEREGGLVPTVAIFSDRPGAFFVLVISLVFAGSASVGAIIHSANFPRYASLCRGGGVASLTVAAAAVTWAVAGACWWWAAALCVVWVAAYAVFAVARG
ncbi:hypothetical protein COCNU_03G014880 [Cocos nucifera]|uniref:Uncharacterized protein n=1 Tax=Cocos nucifera TaxID=13894 RepID=A0A8K0MZE6_COCNU|nr:hypothetical protein COCNU_03G014880 [Cocos nucifera]